MLTPAIDTALQGFVFHQLLMVLCALWAGIFLGSFLAVLGLFVAGRLVTWWTEDTPTALAVKALVAAAKVPADHRRDVAQGLRRIWGEGPFRTVPENPLPPRNFH